VRNARNEELPECIWQDVFSRFIREVNSSRKYSLYAKAPVLKRTYGDVLFAEKTSNAASEFNVLVDAQACGEKNLAPHSLRFRCVVQNSLQQIESRHARFSAARKFRHALTKQRPRLASGTARLPGFGRRV